MYRTHPILAIVAAFSLVVPSLALARAGDPETATTAKPKKVLDPNEVTCVSEPELGSRLVRHRTCMTRAQWAERRAADRQSVERAQSTPCVRGAGC